MSQPTARESPILFSGAMVRAILDGRKSMTRRVVKFAHEYDDVTLISDPSDDGRVFARFSISDAGATQCWETDCPYQPGDALWVRETWAWCRKAGGHFLYRADEDGWGTCHAGDYRTGEPAEPVWHPSIHMPRKASRITLEITGVRVERLQEISEEDAMAEGCKVANGYVFEGSGYDRAGLCHTSPVIAFACLWDEIYGQDSWSLNPWVWAVSFRMIES